jgi:hypothetical protein
VLTQRTRSELRITERHAELDLAARRDELKDEARERRRAAAQRRRLARVDRRGQRRRLHTVGVARLLRRTVVAVVGNVVVLPILASTCSAWWFQSRPCGRPV